MPSSIFSNAQLFQTRAALAEQLIFIFRYVYSISDRRFRRVSSQQHRHRIFRRVIFRRQFDLCRFALVRMGRSRRNQRRFRRRFDKKSHFAQFLRSRSLLSRHRRQLFQFGNCRRAFFPDARSAHRAAQIENRAGRRRRHYRLIVPINFLDKISV